ncbi:Inner membrane transport permease YbhR [Candidatus Protochlamydia amoebophila]|uniref:ABC transporter permease n=1 Tax=Candidatus Protochlamydia amoebophila TaxID=362787 RepID=UPI001BC90249|nr:ABC transporter permease [Candidatus Protochlamydia amoebophila]MBS4164733.1 Inner membrane transport permease YbhR [Candidatus Protochlamydia amoebophila]
MMDRIRALIIKELLAVWRDKKSRFILIIPPLIQLFVFALAGTLEVKNVPIGILNLDRGPSSFELLQRFHDSRTFTPIYYLKSVHEIKELLDKQEVMLIIHLDEQFSRNLKKEQATDVQLILDGRKSNTAQIVQGYVARVIDQFNHDYAQQAGFSISSTELIMRHWFNPNLLYEWFNVPNLMGILTMLVGLIVTALSVARERELGTFDQLLVSPLQPMEILMGKTIPALLIGIIEGTIILLAAVFIFQIPFTGSVAILYLSLFIFISAVVGVGLFISSLCMTQQQAILGTFVFMSPSVMLSGFATPIENMPSWLQTVTLLNPLRYFLVIVKGVFLKNMPLNIVFQNLWPMFLMAIFTLACAKWLFKRRLT